METKKSIVIILFDENYCKLYGKNVSWLEEINAKSLNELKVTSKCFINILKIKKRTAINVLYSIENCIENDYIDINNETNEYKLINNEYMK